jgi:predicted nucleic acid-binding protein
MHTADRAGQFVRHYGASHSVELADVLIAATAEKYGLKLATLNTKHFPMVAKLKPPY